MVLRHRSKSRESDADFLQRIAREDITQRDFARLDAMDPKEVLEARFSDESLVRSHDAGWPRSDVGAATARRVVQRHEDRRQERRRKKELGEREVEHVASTENPAGPFRDVVLQNAWDFNEFFDIGGPLLWSHERTTPNLGKVLQFDRANLPKRGKVIISTSRFTPDGMNEFNDMIWSMVDADFIVGSSVSFRILESVNPTDKEREKLGIGKFGVKVTRANLVEHSITHIPADKGATKLRTLAEELDRGIEEGEWTEDLVELVCRGVPGLYEEVFEDELEDEYEEGGRMSRDDLPSEVLDRISALEEGVLGELNALGERLEVLEDVVSERFEQEEADADEGDEELEYAEVFTEQFGDPAKVADRLITEVV